MGRWWTWRLARIAALMPAREYAEGQIVANQPPVRSSDSESPTDVSERGRARPAWSSPLLIAFLVIETKVATVPRRSR